MRAETAALTSSLIGAMLTAIASSPVSLAEHVAAGPANFRIAFRRRFRGLPVDDGIADSAFAFLCQQAIRRFGALTSAEAVTASARYLDTVEPPPAPPTQAEIDKAWRVDSASSPEGRRYWYGDKHPQEWLDRVIKEGE